jgi:rRNA maturation endonuclease Nob1
MDWCEASAQSDAGITVPGSKSTQSFQTTTVGAMETDRHVLVFKLAGGSAVTKPVTVKHKPKCVTCGKQNRATAKFCTECGTALEIFA